MCNPPCVAFAGKWIRPEMVHGARVLEIAIGLQGVRPMLEAWGPREYIGVNMLPGPTVDRICRVEEVLEEFGPNTFDIVVCTEMLEHVEDWRRAVSNAKQVCREGGRLLFTTRSQGFPFHSGPYDYWRYEVSDFERIFADFPGAVIERDPVAPGVYFCGQKPVNFHEGDLSEVELYSIILGRRVRAIDPKDLHRPRALARRTRAWMEARFDRYQQFYRRLH